MKLTMKTLTRAIGCAPLATILATAERAVAFLADDPRARAAGREFRRDASRFEAEGVGGALSRPRFLLVKRARRPSAQMSKINNLRVRRSD